MTAAGWVIAVDKLIETGQIVISDCDANFAVGMIVHTGSWHLPLSNNCAGVISKLI